MFCPNCGKELPDRSKFCSACGNKIVDGFADKKVVGNEESKRENPTIDSTDSVVESEFSKKKVGGKKVVVGVVVAGVAVAAIFVGKTMLSNAGSSNAYVYLSGGKYELITNLSKAEIIEMDSSKSDSELRDDLVSFSPDGQYIYYFTKYDEESYTGTLCRAEFAKLGENESKNEKYIEIIASDVSVSSGFEFMADGSLIYQNGNEDLYYFDGNSSNLLEKVVVGYVIDEDSNQIVYTTYDDTTGYTIYSLDVTDSNSKNTIATNVVDIQQVSDFDNITYIKLEDDETWNLYVSGITKEEQKLGENVSIVWENDGEIYFTASSGSTYSLYDYVKDTYAEQDAGITEPNEDDYSIPVYSYDKITEYDELDESNYTELYTSCTQPLYWYGVWWTCYSMVDSMDVTWSSYNDEVHAATQEFIDKYASLENEDGYILVTDEIKDALKKINESNPSDDPDNPGYEDWLELCYTREQTGTTIDNDAYNAAYEEWSEVNDRITMRESLQEEYEGQSLYLYSDGNVTTIDDNVWGWENNILSDFTYTTVGQVTDKLKLEDLTDISEVVESIGSQVENHFITDDGTICQMLAVSATTYKEAISQGTVRLKIVNDMAYLWENDGTLLKATVDNGLIGNFSLVTDDVGSMSNIDDTIYYTKGVYENSDVEYGDVYVYENDSSTRIAQDIILDDVYLYEDGDILAYTGYRDGFGYELTLIDSNGETTIIGDDITQYIRVNESLLLYISDGNLYYYDGKENTLISSDVDWIWSQNSMSKEYIY